MLAVRSRGGATSGIAGESRALATGGATSGLPVVATNFSHEVRQFPEVVRAVDGADAFVDGCEEMIGTIDEERKAVAFAEKAKHIARENDWSVIADTFWKTVKQLSEEKQK